MILPFHGERLNMVALILMRFFTHNMCVVIIRTIEPFPHKCDI